MDAKGFDALAKRLADGASRRRALRALAGGAAALGVLGLRASAAGAAEAEATTRCRASREFCDENEDCCSNNCKAGACVCRRRGRNCVFDGRLRDKACCSGRCRQRTGTCA